MVKTNLQNQDFLLVPRSPTISLQPPIGTRNSFKKECAPNQTTIASSTHVAVPVPFDHAKCTTGPEPKVPASSSSRLCNPSSSLRAHRGPMKINDANSSRQPRTLHHQDEVSHHASLFAPRVKKSNQCPPASIPDTPHDTQQPTIFYPTVAQFPALWPSLLELWNNPFAYEATFSPTSLQAVSYDAVKEWVANQQLKIAMCNGAVVACMRFIVAYEEGGCGFIEDAVGLRLQSCDHADSLHTSSGAAFSTNMPIDGSPVLDFEFHHSQKDSQSSPIGGIEMRNVAGSGGGAASPSSEAIRVGLDILVYCGTLYVHPLYRKTALCGKMLSVLHNFKLVAKQAEFMEKTRDRIKNRKARVQIFFSSCCPESGGEKLAAHYLGYFSKEMKALASMCESRVARVDGKTWVAVQKGHEMCLEDTVIDKSGPAATLAASNLAASTPLQPHASATPKYLESWWMGQCHFN